MQIRLAKAIQEMKLTLTLAACPLTPSKPLQFKAGLGLGYLLIHLNQQKQSNVFSH